MIAQGIRKVVDIALKINQERPGQIKYIDIGGGYVILLQLIYTWFILLKNIKFASQFWFWGNIPHFWGIFSCIKTTHSRIVWTYFHCFDWVRKNLQCQGFSLSLFFLYKFYYFLLFFLFFLFIFYFLLLWCLGWSCSSNSRVHQDQWWKRYCCHPRWCWFVCQNSILLFFFFYLVSFIKKQNKHFQINFNCVRFICQRSGPCVSMCWTPLESPNLILQTGIKK